MGVDLGQVAFSLVAKLDQTLQSSISALQRFQTVVGTTAKATETADEATKAFSKSLRDLERATILAVGPLSGVGSRLAVLSAMFDSMTASTAAVVAGIVGVTAVMTVASVATIKATMDMQRFDALLTASTGNSALAADEFNNIAQFANKYGLELRGLVEPYAKFQVAARLSGLAMEDQAKVFEAVTVSSRAMHLNTERTNLVFLAFEQMLSKGTVYMEEMRRQLGDLLPAAFQHAARAMNMTQAEFTKAITEGRILATDLLPKLSLVLLEVFGPAAEKASKNLQAEMDRFKNSLFGLENAFENTTHITEAFTKMVVAATQGIIYLTDHMREIIGVIGAISGGAVTLLLIANLGRLTAGFIAVATSVRFLISMFTELGLAATALLLPGIGSVVSILLRLGAVLLGAKMGYDLLVPAQEDATESFRKFLVKTEEWLVLIDKIGSADAQSAEKTMEATATRLRATYAMIAAHEAEILSLQALQASRAAVNVGEFDTGGGGEDPRVAELEKQLVKLGGIKDQMESIMRQIDAAKKVSATNEPLPGHAFENWVKKVEKDVRDVQSLQQQLVDASSGEEAMRAAKSMGQALNLLATMPEKDRGDLGQVIAMLAEAGYTFKGMVPDTEALKQQLQQLFAAMDKGKDDVHALTQRMGEQKEANKQISNMWEDALAKREAANQSNNEGVKTEERIAKAVNELRQQYVKLFGDTLNVVEVQGWVNNQLEAFGMVLRDTAAIEEYSKYIEKLRKELEQLDNTIGTRLDRSMEKQRDQFNLVVEAYKEGIITFEAMQSRIDTINADAYRAAVSRASLLGREIQSMFRELEDSLARGIADSAMGVDNAWQNTFKNLQRYIYEFMAKAMIVQPIMKSLFGGAYTNNKDDMGTGVFEGLLSGMKGFRFNNMQLSGTESYDMQLNRAAQESGGSSLTQNIGTGGGDGYFQEFATGGSFTVGGSGGTDEELVAFKATPGEHVQINPAGGGGGPMNVSFNITNQSGAEIVAEQTGVKIDADGMVVDLLIRRLSKDGQSRDSINALLSKPRH